MSGSENFAAIFILVVAIAFITLMRWIEKRDLNG